MLAAARLVPLLAAVLTTAALAAEPASAPPLAPRAAPPAPALVVEASPGLESPVMLGVGIGLDAVGVAGLVASAVFFAQADDRCNALPEGPAGPVLDCSFSEGMSNAAGIVSLSTGLVALAVGIPLTVIGAQSAEPAEELAAVPAVSVGPTGGALTWAF